MEILRFAMLQVVFSEPGRGNREPRQADGRDFLHVVWEAVGRARARRGRHEPDGLREAPAAARGVALLQDAGDDHAEREEETRRQGQAVRLQRELH